MSFWSYAIPIALVLGSIVFSVWDYRRICREDNYRHWRKEHPQPEPFSYEHTCIGGTPRDRLPS